MKLISSTLLATGLVAASVLAFALPASAHDTLVSSTPTAGETLTALPEAFSVTMNEDLLDLDEKGSGFGIDIKDADGKYYGDGCVTVAGPTMSTGALMLGKPGEYTFVWQVVSSDGHATSDEFTFTWAPNGDYTAATGATSAGDCNGTYERDIPIDNGAIGVADYTYVWLALGGVALLAAVAVVIVLTVRRKK
jgi:methionine-rich copper-binding protein CopC